MNKGQEKKEFDLLYDYIKKEILKYPNEIALPKYLIMRLKGLRDGKFIVNKKTKAKADYPYSTILLTFKFCKVNILKAIETKRFTNEQNKINYIMAIIENNIGDVVLRLKAKEKAEKEAEKAEMVDYSIKAKKQNKTDNIENENFNSLTNNLW